MSLAKIWPASARSHSLRRDDDRRAEVVALVDERLADVQPGADLEPLAGGRTPRCLLHGDGALHGFLRGAEGYHQPVAEPLHLVAAVGRDCLTQAGGGGP